MGRYKLRQNGPLAFGGISCPLPSRCVAVDDGGNAATTVHPSVGSPWAVMHIDDRAANGLRAVACFSVVLCVAVDQGGAVAIGTLSRGRILRSLAALLATMRHMSSSMLFLGAAGALRVTPPSPGRLTVQLDMFCVAGSSLRSMPLASAALRFPNTAPRALRLMLTGTGRRSLHHASSVRLIADITFTPSGSARATLTEDFTLHR